MFRTILKVLPLVIVVLCNGCVVRPVGPVGFAGPGYYARPLPAPGYGWARPGWRRW